MKKPKLTFKTKVRNPGNEPAVLELIDYNYENRILNVEIGTRVNHKKFYFSRKNRKNKSFKISRSRLFGSLDILEIKQKISGNDFTFYFTDKGFMDRQQFKLTFILPLEYFTLVDDKYEIKFIGYRKNKEKVQQLETEEGVIIFEPD